MKELIAELEAATEGSRGLDEKIHAQVHSHYRPQPGYRPVRQLSLAYTTSIDAALSLVPGGCEWDISSHGRHEGHTDENEIRHVDTTGPLASVHANPCVSVRAATPALALSIAALRARAKASEERDTADG